MKGVNSGFPQRSDVLSRTPGLALVCELFASAKYPARILPGKGTVTKSLCDEGKPTVDVIYKEARAVTV